jgi:hypothetical protein
MTAKFGLLIGAKVTGENNIKKLGNSMQGVQGKAKNLANSVRGIGVAFKGLLAVGAVAGLTALAKNAIDSADSFGKLSTRTGIAANTLMAYVNAGKLADVSQSEIETGLRKLAQTQVEAAEGVKTYSEAYKKLGIDVKKADGSLKPSDKLLGEIADKFKELPNGPAKAAVAMDIFGRSGAKLITMLNGGSESLDAFNVNVSENFTKNAELFNDQLTTIGTKFSEIGLIILDNVLPALTAIAQAFIDFLNSVITNLPTILNAFSLMTKAAVVFGGALAGVAAGKIFTTLITNLGAVLKVTRLLLNAEKARLVIQQGILAVQAASASIGKGGKIGAVLGVGLGVGAIAATSKLIDDLFKNIEQKFAGLENISDLDLPETVTAPGTQFIPSVLEGKKENDSDAKKRKKEADAFNANLIGQAIAENNQRKELLATYHTENQLATIRLQKGQEFADQINEITTLMRKNGFDFNKAFDLVKAKADAQALQDQQDENNAKQEAALEKIKGLYQSIKDTIATGLVNAMQGLIDGTKTLGESLSGILRQLGSIFLQFGMKNLVSSIFPSAKGNVFAQNKIVPFAYGGVVNKPTLFPMANGMGLMGEAGPEAVLPLRRGKGGRLGVETSGGTIGNVVVNVDASGSKVQGNQPDASQLGKAIGQAVQAELIKQKRPGGLLTR